MAIRSLFLMAFFLTVSFRANAEHLSIPDWPDGAHLPESASLNMITDALLNYSGRCGPSAHQEFVQAVGKASGGQLDVTDAFKVRIASHSRHGGGAVHPADYLDQIQVLNDPEIQQYRQLQNSAQAIRTNHLAAWDILHQIFPNPRDGDILSDRTQEFRLIKTDTGWDLKIIRAATPAEISASNGGLITSSTVTDSYQIVTSPKNPLHLRIIRGSETMRNGRLPAHETSDSADEMLAEVEALTNQADVIARYEEHLEARGQARHTLKAQLAAIQKEKPHLLKGIIQEINERLIDSAITCRLRPKKD